jgi:hypothetical protein
MAAVDVALTPFPQTGDSELDRELSEEQIAGVTNALDSSLGIEICVQQLSGLSSAIFVTLENAGAGHNFPSGAAQDRRVWVEVSAYAAGDTEPIYESGIVPDGQAGASVDDPDLWLLRDAAFKESGDPAHLFWEVVSLREETLLPALTTLQSSPDFTANHTMRRFPRDGQKTIPGVLERVRVRVRLRPVGLEILDDLIASGHLDAAVREQMPTFDIIPNRHLEGHPELSVLASSTFEWSQATRISTFNHKIVNDGAFPKDCVGTL